VSRLLDRPSCQVGGIYDRSTKTVRCVTHSDADADKLSVDHVLDIGTPGASARDQFERRRDARERRIRDKHPRIGGLIHALSNDPQSTKAWETGALGEERLGSRLNELASPTLRLLHDRRIPGGKANIDHLAVTSNGVYVIDAKRYRGRPQVKVRGGFMSPRVEKLLVAGRDRTKVVEGVIKQIEIVRDALDSELPVHGVLCFIGADWPLIGGSFTTREVEVTWPKKLYRKLQAEGPVEAQLINETHRRLATTFPPA